MYGVAIQKRYIQVLDGYAILKALSRISDV
jgi:hypothetical protein